MSIAFSEANRHTPKDIEIPGHFALFATPVGDIDKLAIEVVSKVSEYLRTGLNVRIVYKVGYYNIKGENSQKAMNRNQQKYERYFPWSEYICFASPIQ